jgi:hypothetical protein
VHVQPQASEDNNVWLRAGALLVFVLFLVIAHPNV